jgi:hypothetical protein
LIAEFRLPLSDYANRRRQLAWAMFLPARLYDARDLPLQRQLAKTDAAQVELA